MEKQKSAVDLKKIGPDKSQSAIRKYGMITVGSTSLMTLLRYETIMFFCSGLFGAAGIMLRRILYRYILGEMGRNVSIGRNVTIRGAGKIRIARDVMIDDNCVLDARGEGAEIILGEGVLISGGTTIRTRNSKLHIGHGSSIGRNCLLGTDRKLILGSEVLLGAYTYLCAGGLHRFDGPNVSILSQGIDESKGIVIGDGAWLGARTTVLDGVTVGQGSVVGAHSLVNRSIPEMVIAFGSPATIQRQRNAT